MVILFSVEVGAVDGGVGWAAGFFELEEFIGGVSAEFGEERAFEPLEKESERTADNEGGGGFVVNDVD